MSEEMLARVIDATCRTITGHAAELDALDEAIGDGDHGTNLARAAAAIAAERQELAGLPLPRALERLGGVAATVAGGAGGAMYGAMLTGMANAEPSPDRAEHLASMLEGGVEAVRAAGGADRGHKTILDVLIPVARAVRSMVAEGRVEEIGPRVIAAAGHGLHATTSMQAKHGLAADLGVASINRLDAGACSAALIVGAIVGALEDRGAGTG